MKIYHLLNLLIVFLLFTPTLVAQATPDPSQAKPDPSEASAMAEQIAEGEKILAREMENLRDIEVFRDRLIEVSPPTAKETKLVEEIAALEKSLAEKELIADPNILSILTAQRVELLVDIAGLSTRQQMSVQVQAEQQKSAAEKYELAREAARSILELAVKKREQIAALHADGSASRMNLDEAEHAVAIARLQLLEKERELAVSSSPDMNAEIHLALSEKKAQLEVVEKLLADASFVRGDVKRLADLKAWLNVIKDSREYGMVTTLREFEKTLSEKRLHVIDIQSELETLKQNKPK